MKKKAVATDRAPKAIGPYSQGVSVGDFFFLSGQIPLDPSTGEIVGGGIEKQTERVMENLRGVLESQGLAMENVIKTTIFLTNMGNFSKINEVYGRCFKSDPPARSTVEVKGLPRGAEIEIEAIAVR